jgi:hypothetical protein
MSRHGASAATKDLALRMKALDPEASIRVILLSALSGGAYRSIVRVGERHARRKLPIKEYS